MSYRFETDFCRLSDGSGFRTGFISFATGNLWHESKSPPAAGQQQTGRKRPLWTRYATGRTGMRSRCDLRR